MKTDKRTEPRTDILPIHADPEQGLTAQQAEERIAAGWVSGDPKPVGKSESEILLRHCFTFFNFVFLILAVLLVIGHSRITNMSFLVVVVINTVLGVLQEIRAKRAVDALVLVAQRPVSIVRDGQKQEVPANAIVRDDIAEFASGDQLCGDGILRSGELTVDESQITGESDSILKHPGDPVHSGSIVLAGRGRVELTAVGEDSTAAKLSREAKSDPKAANSKSEMMRSLDRLILFIGIALVPVGIALFYQEYHVLQLGIQKSTEGTVAALVGMIPEGLYLLTTIALAVSSRKLANQKVLVQDPNCIETLARVDVLCVDKTGTITQPELEVSDIVQLNDMPHETLQDIFTAMFSGEPDNPTARAMSELFNGESTRKIKSRIPFSSEWKWSGSTFEDGSACVIGAPEFVLGSRLPEYGDTVREWAEQGYRVLLAAQYSGELKAGKLTEEALEPFALILMSSRLRPNAKETFSYFAEEGVRVIVISGDNPATVSKIALSANISGAETYMDAANLVNDEDYDNSVETCQVFGRVKPDQKRKLVAALQAKGHTVAMTGDGVNDLLAMKQSDCSIAMAEGAQAASQLASIVLLDCNFANMPGIVAEGRRVINNIQRAATLFLVKNIFSLFLSVISLYTSWAYPLLPIHLTLLSALTIGAPAFLLTLEPRYERIQGHFIRGVLRRAFPGGLTNVFVVLVCQAFISVFHLSSQSAGTVSTAILAMVGLLVLFQVCKPFNRFRAAIWSMMALGVIGCFVFLPDIFSLDVGSVETQLVMFTLVVMTPTVFVSVQRLFDWGDWSAAHIRQLPGWLIEKYALLRSRVPNCPDQFD